MEYAIYCRRSSDEGSEKQTQSIPDQINRCLDYAEKNGLKIMEKPKDFSNFETEADILKEDLDSDLFNRKVFQKTRNLFIVKESETAKIPYKRKKRRKLMNYIDRGKVKGLLSFSPDRQARNLLEGGELINFVDEEKIDLKYTNFHFEDSASGKMMLGVWFVFAKQYSDAISENINRGVKETVARGKAMGAKKFGYIRNEEGYYAPDGKNFGLMQQAYYMKVHEQKADTIIADWLNDNGFVSTVKGRVMPVTGNKLTKVWKDTFYYGVMCVGEHISDQIADNPYYKPLISQEEYEILADRRTRNNKELAPKQIKDEYREITSVPRGLLKSEDGFSFTFNLPSKQRYYAKLADLKKTNPNATLKHVVKPNQIRYGVKAKDSKFKGLEILASDVDKTVLETLGKLKIDQRVYDEYVQFFKTQLSKLYKKTTEQINVLNLRINNTRAEMTRYVDKHMGLPKDRTEEEIYQNKKKEYEGKIIRLEKERDALGVEERDTMKEYEVFMDSMNKSAEYYQKASYVQKAKICSIFFSNILVDHKKRLHIAVKPIFEQLIISSGADDATRTRNILLGKEVH